MANFGARVCGGIVGITLMTPITGGVGALAGFVYAKFADLPVGQVAKAWAIWFAVQDAFMRLAVTFTENPSTQALIKAAIVTTSTIIGIEELQKRGVLGHIMAIVLVALNTLNILGFLATALSPTSVDATENEQQN